jgi:hypothetical protein
VCKGHIPATAFGHLVRPTLQVVPAHSPRARTSGRFILLAALMTMIAGSGVAAASQATPSDRALQRVHESVRLTVLAGTAHFVSFSSGLGGFSGQDGIHEVLVQSGDIRFRGPDVSQVSHTAGSLSPDSTLDQTFIGRTYYVRSANASSPSTPWSRGKAGQPYPYLGVVPPSALSTARGPAKVLGSSAVNGQHTTEYAVQIPATRRADAPSEVFRAGPFKLDVWLNDKGRIVRTEAKQIVTIGSIKFASTTLVNLSHFGEPVHIVAPS